MFKKLFLMILSVSLIVSVILLQVASAAESYTNIDFESGKLDKLLSSELAFNASGTIVKNISSDGSYSFRSELDKDDPMVCGGKRAELRLKNEQSLEEHWYSVSIYLPDGNEEDYQLDQNSSESLIQWHVSKDEGDEFDSAPLSLQTNNGHYIISRMWDANPVNDTTNIINKEQYAKHDLGSYVEDKGKWVKWTFHVKWGWETSQDPLLEVYKNGVKVLDCDGLPNDINNKNGVYMKFGVYKWGWNDPQKTNSILSKRVVYFDNITIDNPDDIKLTSK